MTNSILLLTDSFETLKQEKDTSIFIMKEALHRGFDVFQCEMKDLSLNRELSAYCSQITKGNNHLEVEKKSRINLSDFSVCFMRKDPPVDQDYMNCLHLLNIAAQSGSRIVNNPNAIKVFNEKIFAMEFIDLMPPTIISAASDRIIEFLEIHKEIVIKPLNGMGGDNIYKVSLEDQPSLEKVKILTQNSKIQIIGQKFLPKIVEGDFRILVIDGKPFEYCLARIPKDGSFLGNLAKGGTGIAKKITPNQKEIAEIVGARLKSENILFAGIDIIDDKLTEINITSPTCAVEIYNQTGKNPVARIFESL